MTRVLGIAVGVILLLTLFNGIEAYPANNIGNSDLEKSQIQALMELSSRLRAARLAQLGYFYGSDSPGKRNSEMINSLLSLPKSMSDAGKRK